jgi:hypothetical protein
MISWNGLVFLVASSVVGAVPGGATTPPTSPSAAETAAIPFGIGGCGGAYFLAEPGELRVEIEKRDRNQLRRRTELRAILVGPDRRVLQEVTIPDDGKPPSEDPGPPLTARLSAKVPRKGVYALNVTASQDRYGEAMFWGFRTNCRRYLIETSRGHRDERHQEPIVFGKPELPGDVCFLPRPAAFRIEAADLAGGRELEVYDESGQLVRKLPIESGGRASAEFAADARRGSRPWRLHLPSQRGTIHIDGVTRWESHDPFPNLSLWSSNAASWFPFHEYRWILTPYSRFVYGRAGTDEEAVFQVHNNSDRTRTIRLAVEFPETPWPVRLPAEKIQLRGKQSANVTVRFKVPGEGQTAVCHLRATPQEDPDFSTYSTLTVKAGTPPAASPLKMPLVLAPYRHENEQFGYLPDFPLESQVYFDPRNQPWVRTSRGVETWRDGKWEHVEVPGGMATSKIAFDREGDVYLLVGGRRAALLHSRDGGKTFKAYPIPSRHDRPRSLDFEVFTGHNVSDGPPPILSCTQTAADPKQIWRRIHDLELHVPTKSEGKIHFHEPVLVSTRCIGFSMHSGAPSCVVSRDEKIHVVWAEATDPEMRVPGVPTYVVTYDRAARRLGKPALVGHGPPPNDIHNTPSITMDSQGYLHVLAGTHGRPFPYARSLAPNEAGAGWTEVVPAEKDASQTYIGLVCGPDDTLHLVYRLWQTGKEPFPASHYATLAYQRKRPGKPWEPPRILIVPPFSEYSVFYHRLTIDRQGRLFLSYDYWSTYWFYRTDHRGSRRAVLMSPDGGQTWKLAQTEDLGCQHQAKDSRVGRAVNPTATAIENARSAGRNPYRRLEASIPMR